jgi:hypothetical protein
MNSIEYNALQVVYLHVAKPDECSAVICSKINNMEKRLLQLQI